MSDRYIAKLHAGAWCVLDTATPPATDADGVDGASFVMVAETRQTARAQARDLNRRQDRRDVIEQRLRQHDAAMRKLMPLQLKAPHNAETRRAVLLASGAATVQGD